jgi:hypothetical protein
MRIVARVSLAIVLLAAGLLVPRLGVTPAQAVIGITQPVPTPLLSDIIGEPEPDPTEDPTGGGGGGSGGGGDEDPGDDGSGGGGGSGDGKKGDRDGDGKIEGDDEGPRPKGRRNRPESVVPPSGTPSIPGSFTTNELMAIAAHLRSLGLSAQEVIKGVYPPFIIAGEATWIDTWGVPRYGPGPIVRTHEGQDVFCDYGDPVLAPEAGYVSFSDGGLGGITARVHTPDGAYWYMTHLSDLNTEQLSAGDQVVPGTVVGYCGNSGNAASTPPHVHFGWYQANGVAKNPMRSLVSWLRDAENSAVNLLASVQGARQKQLPTITAARRFGDAFAPDSSVLPGGAGESLWASGSSPSTGAFALAQVALQAALAEPVAQPDAVLIPTSQGAGVEGLLDPESSLAQLLKHRHADESAD